MGKVLTEELVIEKTKCSSLAQIKNFNLWGSDLEDVSILKKMPNAEVLSLSLNKISSLKDFTFCKNLQELYLRKNNISDLTEIRYLSQLPSLKVLWLLDNPCSELQDYRATVISYLPNLLKLDNTAVTPEERSHQQAEIKNQDQTMKTDISRNFQTGTYVSEGRTRGPDFSQEKQNQNIVCAVLSLVSELDINSLEVIRREIVRSLERSHHY